jgi:hypothetical protein
MSEWEVNCHPERSEGSAVVSRESKMRIPRCARNDNIEGVSELNDPKGMLSL